MLIVKTDPEAVALGQVDQIGSPQLDQVPADVGNVAFPEAEDA